MTNTGIVLKALYRYLQNLTHQNIQDILDGVVTLTVDYDKKQTPEGVIASKSPADTSLTSLLNADITKQIWCPLLTEMEVLPEELQAEDVQIKVIRKFVLGKKFNYMLGDPDLIMDNIDIVSKFLITTSHYLPKSLPKDLYYYLKFSLSKKNG